MVAVFIAGPGLPTVAVVDAAVTQVHPQHRCDQQDPDPVGTQPVELTRSLGHLILCVAQRNEFQDGSLIEVSGGVPA
jgi:hypothetical protein